MSGWVTYEPGLLDAFDLKTMVDNICKGTKRRGRTREQVLRDVRIGMVGEVLENRGHEAWMLQRFKQSQEDRDDGGIDTPDGRQVKAIDANRPTNHKRVFVSDMRAEDYVVWEVDEPHLRARRSGTFKRSDIVRFWTDNDAHGVYIDVLTRA